MKLLIKSVFGSFLVTFNVICTLGQDYSALNLKPELTKNANAIIRLHEVNLEVVDTSKAIYHFHDIITVLNENGEQQGVFAAYYNSKSKIQDLSGKLYNKLGLEVKKTKSSDFADVSAISSYSIYEDYRMKYAKPVVNSYPYTIEYEYTYISNDFMYIPAWFPQSSYNVSVEKGIYNISVPVGFKISYKTFNNALPPTITEEKGIRKYKITCENLPAIEEEILSTGLQDLAQKVYFIPEYYKIGPYTCKSDNWQSFGSSRAKFIKQPNQLSEKTLAELKAIKEKSASKRELVKNVYEYMQAKTRYVSIQIGIGGLKPFDASLVDKNGYGDCKALVNYTQTLLSNVGVNSIYTLVKADEDYSDIIPDLPIEQFNHIILCVPDEKDTIWLECTSQLIPFGFLGKFTDNRHVLLVKEDGGELKKTRYYCQKDNQQKDKYEVQIKPDGEASAKVSIQYTGLQYDDKSVLLFEKPVDQKESLYNHFRLPVFEINNYNLKEVRDELPVLNLDMDLNVKKYAMPMGNRLLLAVNMLNKRQPISDINKERKSKMRVRYPYFDSDTVLYHIPDGYTVESLPKDMELKSAFGSYKAQVISDEKNKTLQYIREFRINDGVYPPEQYKDYVSFIKSVSTFDNVKVSLIQKT